MSLRKRYPLETLLRLREHRTERARLALLDAQRHAQACRDQCTQIEGEIDALDNARRQQRARLMSPPPAGMGMSAALQQRECHVAHLLALADAARERLVQAQQRLQQAEQAQAEARTAYFRARSRQDALQQRRDMWRRDLRLTEARRDEAATDDLMSGRRHAVIRS